MDQSRRTRSRLLTGAVTAIAAAALVGCTSGPFSEPYKTEDPYKGPGEKPFAAIQVGECISGADFGNERNQPVTTATCPTPWAPYELVTKGPMSQPCPDGKGSGQDSSYAVIVHTIGADETRPEPVETLYCFAFNVVPGDCYFFDVAGVKPLNGVDCQNPLNKPGLLTAAAQHEGDPNAGCDPGQERYSWPKPPRVVCLAPITP